jgi:hypothetical protein
VTSRGGRKRLDEGSRLPNSSNVAALAAFSLAEIFSGMRFTLTNSGVTWGIHRFIFG